MKSILIKDTTREERIKIVRESLKACGGEIDSCDSMGGGRPEEIYKAYIDGHKELKEINEEYRCSPVK